MDIEESVEYLKNCIDDEYDFKNATRKKDKEAYKIILTAYEEEKEKNKEFEKNLKVIQKFANTVKRDCISKDKIKAKIEELDNPESETFKTLFDKKESTWSATIQRFLQSLLEEEE